MYYTVEEIKVAINEAKTIINSRTKEVNEYTRGYNDCFALLVEYDKALRGGKTSYNFDFDYSNFMEFFAVIRQRGYKNLKELAEEANYEIIKTLRPQFGDIAFERPTDSGGAAMIAGDGCWVSTTERNTGITNKRPLFFLERKLLLLARPLRSHQ